MRYIPHRLGIADVLEKILNESIKPEFMGTVGKFLLPLLAAVLLVFFIVEIFKSFRGYKEHGEVEFTKPLVIGICLAIAVTANGFMWAIIGW